MILGEVPYFSFLTVHVRKNTIASYVYAIATYMVKYKNGHFFCGKTNVFSSQFFKQVLQDEGYDLAFFYHLFATTVSDRTTEMAS